MSHKGQIYCTGQCKIDDFNLKTQIQLFNSSKNNLMEKYS